MPAVYCYSDVERRLVAAIAPDWEATLSFMMPNSLYCGLAHEAFIKNLTGPAVEALRRACLALQNSTCDRSAPEFDELCKF